MKRVRNGALVGNSEVSCRYPVQGHNRPKTLNDLSFPMAGKGR